MFELAILHLLERNNFHLVNANVDGKIKMEREFFYELRGRGGWHQIDCPCDYEKHIPFMYPIRMLGEVKFLKTPIEKRYVREFIGVVKDIQENYFVSEDEPNGFQNNRKMDIGVFFSASGFNAEAEKLAYAHGIKTISYDRHFLIDRIKDYIIELEQNYISVNVIRASIINDFKRAFYNLISGAQINERMRIFDGVTADGFNNVMNALQRSLSSIQSSFLGTTKTGVFMHFIGEEPFPDELFTESDDGICRVYYEINNFKRRYFYITIHDDFRDRKFYFTPPESLDKAALFGKSTILQEKEELFGEVNININLRGINRNLTLRIDTDWIKSLNKSEQQEDVLL